MKTVYLTLDRKESNQLLIAIANYEKRHEQVDTDCVRCLTKRLLEIEDGSQEKQDLLLEDQRFVIFLLEALKDYRKKDLDKIDKQKLDQLEEIQTSLQDILLLPKE